MVRFAAASEAGFRSPASAASASAVFLAADPEEAQVEQPDGGGEGALARHPLESSMSRRTARRSFGSAAAGGPGDRRRLHDLQDG
jgi:hypothetical protein